jgi:hypothetical protein
MFDVAVDGPLEYVKEPLKVGFLLSLRPCADCSDKSNGGKASVASSCFDRVNGLQDQGFDESDIRMVISTAYIGDASHSPEIESPVLNESRQLRLRL